jgi:protein TonB
MHATPYRTQKSKRNYVPFIGGFAAVVVLGLAVAFYPWHNNNAAPVASASAPVETARATTPPTSPVAVSSPKSSVEPPVAVATSAPAAATSVPAKSTETVPAATQPKPAAGRTAQDSAPVLHLASSQPKVKSEEPVESPTLALVGAASKSLPDLPLVATPSAALAVRKPVAAVLVPAARLRGAPPQFPAEAKTMHRSGVVKLQISIDADGKVTDARVLTGDLLFRPASIAAVRDWVYSPARLDGKPVASTAEVNLRFNADGH